LENSSEEVVVEVVAVVVVVHQMQPCSIQRSIALQALTQLGWLRHWALFVLAHEALLQCI
jgi:hypothetical protein